MSRLVVGPFNRVEGDLEVKLDIEAGRVQQAWVNCTLYRGFEQILRGKPAADALVLTPRICGICSVAQSAAAARALAQLQGGVLPPNAERAANLVQACENLADHLSHFYLFFMPDFAREHYRDQPWYDAIAQRFRAITGSAAQTVIPARSEFMHLMGLLAGKWPHTLALQPGGSTRAVQPQERLRLLAIVKGFRRFLERETFGDRLEAVAKLHDLDALQRWQLDHADSDLGRFLMLSERLELAQLGRGYDRFMSYGSYRSEGIDLLKPGVWSNGWQPLDTEQIREDVSHSWMKPAPPLSPIEGETLPDLGNSDGYSWCKAPRLDGHSMEVGALARQLIDGHPLAAALVAESGGNVRNRVVMRLVELARILIEMERWVLAIEPGQPFYRQPEGTRDGVGVGLIEAARGSLGHWLEVRNGLIHNYQIIAPTTWNFSPRDGSGQPGALELALQNTPVQAGETDPVAVQHVVRSFDPCMVCTVH